MIKSVLVLDGDFNVEFIGLVVDASGEFDEMPPHRVEVGEAIEQLADLWSHKLDESCLSIFGEHAHAVFGELSPLPVGGVEQSVDGELSLIPCEVQPACVAVGHGAEAFRELLVAGSPETERRSSHREVELGNCERV